MGTITHSFVSGKTDKGSIVHPSDWNASHIIDGPVEFDDGETIGGVEPSSRFIISGSVNSAATLDIILTGYTEFRALRFYLTKFIPATNAVELWLRTSTDGGSSYAAGASDYSANWDWNIATISAGNNDADAALQNQATLAATIANAATTSYAALNAELTLFHQTAADYSRGTHMAAWITSTSAGETERCFGGFFRNTAADVDAVRFMFSSGNIASGSYSLFGVE